MTATLPAPVRPAPPLSARELADLTPPDRDRVVDLIRVAAIAVVVLGHWLMAVVSHGPRGIHGQNLLEVVAPLRWVTWALQVMPLFFLAGGVANAASWESARQRGHGYSHWLRGRLNRLTRPVLALATVWIVGLSIAASLGADPKVLHTGARLIAMPLWFLAVYVGVVALAPVMLAAHRRWGVRVVLALGATALAVDVASHTPLFTWIAWTNFAFVWLFAHQLGFFWRDGRLGRRADGVLLLGGGLLGLVALTHAFGYPVSMVGLPGQASNNTPPTVALVALACAQTGALMLARRRLAGWLERPKVWRTVIRANGIAMTLYLWHLSALCLAALALVATGWFPQPAVASTAWWLLRPVWLLILLAVLVPLVALWSRVEQRPPTARSGSGSPVATAGTLALLMASLTWVSIYGFPIFNLR